MRLDVVTLFPSMFEAITRHGVTGRAVETGRCQLKFWNPRDYTSDRWQTVDDRPYGGGPGMVMKVEPLLSAIEAAKQDDVSSECRVIYLSPQGKRIQQSDRVGLLAGPRPILVAGRYEGVDERLIQLAVDEEWSIGDYILTGGELAAMVILDAVLRLVPGVLGDEASAEQESFSAGLLDCPHYTRPVEVCGLKVPEVLRSGDHQAIAAWRHQQQLERTQMRRPDLLQDFLKNFDEDFKEAAKNELNHS